MNGFDHTRPDPRINDLLTAVAAELDRPVVRGTLDDAVAATTTDDRPEHTGELVGGRVANLLPGVWSTRMPLKIRNRSIEHLLERWAEPWVALGRALGLPDESPSLREAWRSLLLNQAHDSICGCSIDAVHDRMAARYDDAEGLATETIERVLQRLAGRPVDRDVPDLDDLEVVVFNGSPHPVTDVVRVPIDAHPAFAIRLGVPVLHSVVEGTMGDLGFTIGGAPARVIESDDEARVRWFPGQAAVDVEFIAADVPAFGCRRYRLTRASPVGDRIDDGREIATTDVRVAVEPGGTLTLETPEGRWTGLFGVEDVGDRGDSYDVDPVGDTRLLEAEKVDVARVRHESGITRLRVDRVHRVPAGLTDDRTGRTEETVEVHSQLEITVIPGVPELRVSATLHNTARDHRLRLVFPTGSDTTEFLATTTFDAVARSTIPPDDTGWVHPAPTTFCNQGGVSVNGLTIIAPGLPEAEVRPDGTVLLTLVRAVGWLARDDLATRPMPAGPAMRAPGAQCLGRIATNIMLSTGTGRHLLVSPGPPLRGVVGGPAPLLANGRSMLGIDNEEIVVTAVKPAAIGADTVVRLLNPTDRERRVTVTLGSAVTGVRSVRLDESDDDGDLDVDDSTVTLAIGAHQLRSLRIAFTPTGPRPR